MKTKISFVILAVCYLLLSLCSAQDFQLWEIKFCNNWETTNELDLVTKAWEEASICIDFANTTPRDMTINVDFLDAIITQDKLNNRACNPADKPKTSFGNFMIDYEKVLTIPWNSTVQKIYNIKLPIWFKWISHGCVAYNMVQTGKQVNQTMLNVIVRKVKFIDILVWEAQVKSQISIWSIKKIKTWKTTNFQIWFKNIWNTAQTVTVSWTISNIFWFKQPLKFDKNTIDIPPNEEMQMQTNNEKLYLPFYKWFFTIHFGVTNKPNFNFNITNTSAPQQVALGWKFALSKMIFIPNYYVIWVILLLIYVNFLRRRKRHPTTQPMDHNID